MLDISRNNEYKFVRSCVHLYGITYLFVFIDEYLFILKICDNSIIENKHMKVCIRHDFYFSTREKYFIPYNTVAHKQKYLKLLVIDSSALT